MHGCSDERGQINGGLRLYIRTLGFLESLESHAVRFTAWIIGYGIPRRFEVFPSLDSRVRRAFKRSVRHIVIINECLICIFPAVRQLDFTPFLPLK